MEKRSNGLFFLLEWLSTCIIYSSVFCYCNKIVKRPYLLRRKIIYFALQFWRVIVQAALEFSIW